MRVLLRLQLHCEPDTAWDKLHDPRVFSQVMFPLMTATSIEPGGYPERWGGGEHAIALKLFGVIPMGTQLVRLSEREGVATGIRILRDRGVGTSGGLTLMRNWDHQMAISPTADGRTLYRDQLKVSAGWLSPIVWPGLWSFWQWRAMRLSRLSADW